MRPLWNVIREIRWFAVLAALLALAAIVVAIMLPTALAVVIALSAAAIVSVIFNNQE